MSSTGPQVRWEDTAKSGAEPTPSWLDRLRLRNFWFWRNIGGPLPHSAPEPLRLRGIFHLMSYIRHVWWAAIGLLATIFISGYLGVLPAFVIKQIVNQDITAHTTGPLFSDIGQLIILYLLIALVNVLNGWLGSWSNSRIVWRMREDIFQRQLSMPLSKLVDRGAGQTTVRAINEVGVPGGDSPVFSGVAGILNTITSAINNIVTLISAVIAMFALNVELTLWCFILLPIALVLAVWWGRIAYGAAHRQYESLTSLTNFLLRHTTRERSLLDALLGRRRQVAREFSEQSRILTNASIFERVLPNWYNNLFTIITGATTGIIWLVGGHHVFAGTLTVGVVVAMISLISKLNGPINSLADLWFSFRSLAAIADRVSQDLEDRSGEADGREAHAATATPLMPPYTLNGATLADERGATLVSDLNFTLHAGEVLTVVDSLLPEDGAWCWAASFAGWLPLVKGALEVGGVRLDGVDAARHRATISLVSSVVPVVGMTLQQLWQAAAPMSDEQTWRKVWKDTVDDAIAFPCVDLDLNDEIFTPVVRFAANLVVAQLRGATVWVVVGEPDAVEWHWTKFGKAVIRIQPAPTQAVAGSRYLIRRQDGSVMLDPAPEVAEACLTAAAAQKVVQPVKLGWSPDILKGDGAGWWASMGLRRNATKETGRFFVPFKWLFDYIRRYWVYWLIILVLGETAATFGHTLTPLFSKNILDNGITAHNLGALNINGFLIIVFGVVQGICNALFVTLFVQAGGKRMCGEIREDFFASLMRAPINFFRKHDSSEIATRGINDINAIFSGTDQLIKVLTWQIIPNIPGMVLLWTIGGARYGFLTLLVDLPFIALTIWVARLNSLLQQRLFQIVGALFSELRQMVSLPRATLVRATGLEAEQTAVMSALNHLIYRLGLVQSLRTNWYATVSTIEGNALTAVFWLVGGLAVIHGHLTLGVLTAIMTYSQLYIGLGGGVSSYVTIYGTLANVDRVAGYVDTDGDVSAVKADQLTDTDTQTATQGDNHVLSMTPGTVQRIHGTPQYVADMRDAMLRLRPIAGMDVRVGAVHAHDVDPDTWRKTVAWITLDFPFAGASVRELLDWAATSAQALAEAKRFLHADGEDAALDVPADRWTQGRKPEQMLQLLGALAIAQQARLVIVEIPAAWARQAEVLIQSLSSDLATSAMVVLEADGEDERPA